MNTTSKDLDLTGRILTHQELSKQQERGTSGKDNESFFRYDFKMHLLDKYKGTAVVYWKGILCGQNVDADNLLKKAGNYYGHSNLNAFDVPKDENGLDKAVSDAYARQF